jgi:hypothetical protein
LVSASASSSKALGAITFRYSEDCMSPRKWLLMCCRIALAVGALLLFFLTAPWLNAKPLSDLPATYHAQVPTWAKSFTTDHSFLVFHDHGTISEEPVQFALRVGLTLVLLGMFAASLYFPRNRQ